MSISQYLPGRDYHTAVKTPDSPITSVAESPACISRKNKPATEGMPTRMRQALRSVSGAGTWVDKNSSAKLHTQDLYT